MTAAARGRVLVAGDANLDLLLTGDVEPRFGQAEQLLDSADLVLGSSAGICASALARLGSVTAIVAAVGADDFGRRTRELLERAGVDTGELRVATASTGLSIVLDRLDDRAILTFAGALAQLTSADVRAAVERTAPAHLHVASFFLVPDFARGLADVLHAARADGVSTSLDPNWDPSQGWDAVIGCLPHVDVLLPNRAECLALAAVLGPPTDDLDEAGARLASVVPVVAVKDGAAGARAFRGSDSLTVPALAVDPVDTTGAGDTFDGGFLTAWLEGRDLEQCLRWGVAAGTLSTRAPGGTRAQPSRAELVDALHRVE